MAKTEAILVEKESSEVARQSCDATPRLTNKLGLPEPIVRAVSRDPYKRGDSDFTVTELLKPPRARALIKQHQDEIVEDVADRIWALCGQIGHTILERAGGLDIVERRFSTGIGGSIVSGQADLILRDTDSELIDYKFCSVYSAVDGLKPEWEQQCNMLAYLAHEDQRRPVTNIHKASIVALYRDWSKPKAAREKDYPQNQVQVFDVPLWSLQRVANFIMSRLTVHEMAEKELPLCSNEERWKTQDKWAVLKKGNKRAHRLLDNEEQANKMAALEKMIVEFRPGEAKRCANYCLAFPFCEQAQSELEAQIT